jgi:hypothetical protein
MARGAKRISGLIFVATLLSAGPARPQQRAVSVSPGEESRVVQVENRCPTFSWAAAAEATGYELIIYELPAEEGAATLAAKAPLARRSFPAGVFTWTPSLESCLDRGKEYAWAVRPRTSQGSNEWSEPRLFRVSAEPPLLKVEEALVVLRDYLAAGHDPALLSNALRTPDPLTSRGDTRGDSRAPEGTAPDAVAVRGQVTNPSGVTYGVHGISASSDQGSAGVAGEATSSTGLVFGVAGLTSSDGGGGVAAINNATTGEGAGLFARTATPAGAAVDAEAEASTGDADGVRGRTSAPGGAGVRAAHRASGGGADLVLDGQEQALTDAVLTESGLDRPSGGAETFNFSNSGGGTMTLRAQGVDIVTTATDQDALGALACSDGEVPRLAAGSWTCSPDQDTVGTLACAEGAVARQVGGSWTCSTDEDSLGTLSCSNGQIPRWTGSSWDCDTDLDTDTLSALACAYGDVAVWTGAGWECRCIANQSCYTGPPDTLDVGQCKAGNTLCGTNSSGSTCYQETTPLPEQAFCDLLDDDCNGDPTENCVTCDPLAQDCSSGDACIVVEYENTGGYVLEAFCLPPGTGAPGDDCSTGVGCQPGSGCYPVESGSFCFAYCDAVAYPNDYDPDFCQPGEICFPLGETPWGICVTP